MKEEGGKPTTASMATEKLVGVSIGAILSEKEKLQKIKKLKRLNLP